MVIPVQAHEHFFQHQQASLQDSSSELLGGELEGTRAASMMVKTTA